jgi:hypothetical protein
LREAPAAQSARLLRCKIDEIFAQKGLNHIASIPPATTFLDWCELLAERGLKVDNIPFTLIDRPAMRFIYSLIPTTPEDALGRMVVMMKCAQVGFTVMEMLAAIYMAMKFEPCKIGMFLPDMSLAAGKSSERFMPILRTIPEAYAMLRAVDSAGRRRSGEGNVMIRAMGESRLHFLWTSGKATTESYPIDCLSFDEVQQMKIADMEKTKERLSASRIKFTLMGSTANWPDRDIHFWYKRGTQHRFHTKCLECGVAAALDEHFPDCIGFDATEGVEDYRYKCHACGAWIDDTQEGEWVPTVPDAQFISVHFHQMLSPTISAREIIEAYHNADDMQNFYNRKLGKPYADPSQIPVNLAMLNACMQAGIEAGVQWKQRGTNTFMGIDQMGQFNVVIIKERLADGRQAVIHLEYIYDENPFARCDDLMKLYGVQICVVETLPNYNDAKAFAKRHYSRVFLASYQLIDDEMLRWGDTDNSKADRKISDEARDRYTVSIDQYKMMQVAMARFQKTACLFPNSAHLTQEVIEKGERKRVQPLKDMAFLHFQRTALVVDRPDPDQKKYRRRVVKVGIDPHTSYANMLCDVAWARAYGTGIMILPQAPASPGDTDMAQKIEKAMPGLPPAVLRMIDQGQVSNTCGRCTSFAAGQCIERGFNVRPQDPGCPLYIEKEE